MADADHAPSFWKSVAKAFNSNHGVLFDLFNEPYIDSWSCWEHGCQATYEDNGKTVTYETAGMQALVDAVRRITGLETTTDGIPVHGMLDPEILTCMMHAAGIDDGRIAAHMPAIVESAQEIYQRSVPDIRDKICPGVLPLLDHLRERGVALALVTGNLTRIGWRKLHRAGLDHYFRFGAFGEMAPTRGGLARLAIEQAKREGITGNISLIGDAVQDVEAARENGIRAIAVRTGITPPEELERSAPDLLLDDLTQFDPAFI